ncbi:MAG TPA: glycosyltransferase family 4 protein [Ignavibacteriales bacterium]|nr:glycosyltransferase family 4 protein [Ignavibacteriales bacterium]HRT99090.1 glycosyltransferase family 4 protein [Ignavibacteriales bacterium]
MEEINNPPILQLISIKFWNAAAHYATNLSIGLQKYYNIDSFIILPSYSKAFSRIKAYGFSPINYDLRTPNPLKLLYYSYQISKLCKKQNIKIINCHYGEALLVAVISKILFSNKANIIRTVVDVREPKSNFINKLMFKNFVKKFIVSCEDTKKRYQKNFPFLHDKKFEKIYYAHDRDAIITHKPNNNYKETLNLPKEAFIVSTIARLSPEKGHKFLLNIANKVIKQNPNIYFIIAGEQVSVPWDELYQICKSYNIENNIIYINHPKQVYDIITITDVGLITSQSSEAACRIATEFFTFGKPVVATNPNVLKEMIIDNKNGFLIDIDDVDKAASSIIELFNNKDLYQQISLNNLQQSKSIYDLKYFTDKHISIFKEILENNYERN